MKRTFFLISSLVFVIGLLLLSGCDSRIDALERLGDAGASLTADTDNADNTMIKVQTDDPVKDEYP